MLENASVLPCELYKASQISEAELSLVSSGRANYIDLVESAGDAAYRQIVKIKNSETPILVLVGNGNNGADAFVCARHLLAAGYDVSLMAVSRDINAKGASVHSVEYIHARDGFKANAGVIDTPNMGRIIAAEVIIDGLLGIGLKGEIRAPVRDIITAINSSNAWVFSLDLPSGINADTGSGHCVVQANMTMTFGGVKQGLLTGHARQCVGELFFADLGLSAFFPESKVTRVSNDLLADMLLPRARDSHKGLSGKVTVVGGDKGMAGAIKLAAEACLRAGTGLVTVLSRPEHLNIINANRPELMFWGCEVVDMEVYLRLGWANTLIIGPGLGKQSWGYNLFKAVRLSDKPCVVDADALNLLSEEHCNNNNWVLTPHSGEAARLLGITIAEVERDRFAAADNIQKRYGGVVVLKGPGSLIFDGKKCVVAPVGNPGLASGGCGDVLTGVIAALISQGFSLFDAAIMGVIVHGEAADRAVTAGERGMLASDLMPHIRSLVNHL
ncbi:yjeF-like protein, hydroxyethylthiazole kinase-related [Shewanella psychrophila]|uniref:Bifunctional NAD(P)H-hydrate repair enzyme n=1 Tax=Shewanella psychrophila TaxID=225848 RepID=A0A1S6HX57_9GAMM|nr:bifunctional ADP-dependent NAD(P)H-hydrate dehydratase/NAD(P)H-hydrate epimerase [Shewanella psychrophila]AQS40157.1 yjeF-like protein, hydroxyethylthiazole kinase-related [Shewanella psychrophila]